MLGKFFDTIWPLKELLNYIFKKSLGDYITNDLDLNRIEIEIKNKAFISLKNLELNAQEINNKHLRNSPIKMLDGRISRLDLYISKDKIEFKIEEIFILLMPVFNIEKINGNINKQLKKQGVNMGEDTGTGHNVENSMISNLINSALSNLEISVKNICIKVLTYEVCNNAQDNPTFSIYLSRVEYKSKYSPGEKNPSQDKDKLFLLDKQIIFDKLCVKVNKNFNNDEINFFNLSNLNDEKLLFNFFCDNSTILAMNYSGYSNDVTDDLKDINIPGVNIVDVEETVEDNSKNKINDCSVLINLNKAEKDSEGLKIDIALKRIEIILNPLQLQYILNFFEVCGRIFRKQCEDKCDNGNKVNSSDKNIPEDNYILNNNYNFSTQIQKPIKIFNSKISNIILSLNLEMLNCIVIENTYSYEVPKLWSFFEKNYSKEIKTVDNLESHFSYLEDNFFILNLNKINLRHSTFKLTGEEKIESSIESLYLKYTEYKNKIKREKSEKKLKFTNSRLLSINPLNITKTISPLNNFINVSNVNNMMMNMSINASKASQRMNDHSLNQTIYQSVESNRNNSKDSNNTSFSNTVFESAMESELILVNKYSKLLEYDYFYHSFPVICLTPQYKSENTCLQVKLVKSVSVLEKKKEIFEKKFVNFMFGDLNCEFHPVFLFKFAKLYRNNVVLINEVLFYFTNLYNEKNNFNAESVVNVKENVDEKQGSASLNSNKNSSKNDSITSSVITQGHSQSIESLNKKRIITQFFIVFNEIKLLLTGFSNDSISCVKDRDRDMPNRNLHILNSLYFKNFYQNNIHDVLNIRSAEGPGYKINIKPDPSLQTLKSKENIQIKFSRTSILVNLQEKFSIKDYFKQHQKKGEIMIKFSQVLLYLNDNLITNYQKENEPFKVPLNNSSKSISNISDSAHGAINSNNINESQFSHQPSYTHVINKNPNKKFITGNYMPHKLSDESHDERDIDSVFSRNKMKFRNSDIRIDLFSFDKDTGKDRKLTISNKNKERSPSLDIHKHVAQYIEKVHKQFNVKEDIHEIISRIFSFDGKNELSLCYPSNNIKIFSRAEVTIDINEININVDMYLLSAISEFLDGFLFTINMFKILNTALNQLHQGIKEKIFDLYDIKSINKREHHGNRTNANSNNSIDNHASDNSEFKLNLLNLSVQKINISIDKLAPQDEVDKMDKYTNPKTNQQIARSNLIHCEINKINTSLIAVNENNQVFCNLNNLMVNLFKRGRNLNEEITRNSSNYHRVVYNGESIASNNSNLNTINFLELKLDFKKKKCDQEMGDKRFLANFLKEFHSSVSKNTSANTNVNQFAFESIEDFLSHHLIKLNDIQMNISLITSNLILAPIFKDFDAEIIQELYHQVITGKNKQTSNIPITLIRLIDQRNVDLYLDLKFQNLAIDLFYNDKLVMDPKHWMRLIITFERISYILDNKNSTTKIENFVINLLRDLRIEEADGLLTDKIINIGKEDSRLKKIGFVEIINCDLIRLNMVTKKNYSEKEICDKTMIKRTSINETNNISEKDYAKNITKENKIDILINAFEFKFCKDSFLAFRTFIEKMNEISKNLVKGVKETRKKWKANQIKTYTNNNNVHTEGINSNLKSDLKSEIKNKQTAISKKEEEKPERSKGGEQKSIRDTKLESAFNLELFEDYCQDDYRDLKVEMNPYNDGKKEAIKFITGLSDTKQLHHPDYKHTSSNNKQNSRRKRSSFEIVPENKPDDNEYDYELKDKIKFHKETLISISLNNFRVYLFEGNDFDFYCTERFAYSKNKNLFLSHASHSFNASLVSQNSSSFDIIEDYLSSGSNINPTIYKNFSQIKKNLEERKRISFRDYDNQICVNVQNFQVEGLFVHKIAESKSEFTMTRVKIIIYKFDIDDLVKSSKYKKLLSKYEYDNKQPLIEVEIETKNSQNKEFMNRSSVRNVNVSDAELEEVEVYIDAKVLPINILLDQVTLIFLLEFFEVKLQKVKKNPNQEKENLNIPYHEHEYEDIVVKNPLLSKPILSNQKNLVENSNASTIDKTRKDSIKLIFVRRVKLEEFFINFSYNSHSISIEKIKNKNYLELLNLSNISDFRIILKDFEFVGCLTVHDTIEMIVNYWKEDITKNQIISALLTSVSLIRPFITILRGFFDIFKQPWIYYKTEKSLKDGFSKGIKNFIFSLSSQSLFLGEKIFVTLKNHLGSSDTGNQGSNLGKNSYYKKFIYYINDSKKKYDEYYLKK